MRGTRLRAFGAVLATRWPGRPEVWERQALLLLPRLPESAWIVGRPGGWADALAACGVRVVRPSGPVPGLTVSIGEARQAARTNADLILLVGRDPGHQLRRAGYVVRRWRVSASVLGAAALVPVGDRPLARHLRTGGRARTWRQIAGDSARRLQRHRNVVVAARTGPVPPAAIVAAGLAPAARAGILVDPLLRRRSVFVVAEGTPLRSRTAIKVTHLPDGRQRSQQEQAMLDRLAQLGLGRGAPTGLGWGTMGIVTWSAETAAAGLPLPQVLLTSERDAGMRLLDDIAMWFTDLAVASRDPQGFCVMPALRGPHGGAASLLEGVARVPGVLVHGDVASGHNIMVGAGREFCVIDWELASEGGLPLSDLLPLLCSGLARLRRLRGRHEEAAMCLEVCRGHADESEWLLAHVSRYLDTVGVPLRHAGALAGIAFASWASMRFVHDELLTDFGCEPEQSRWKAPDLVAPAWRDDRSLVEWRALREHCART